MKKQLPVILFLLLLQSSCSLNLRKPDSSIQATMNELTQRLDASSQEQDFEAMDQQALLDFMTVQERNVLGAGYWQFHVNVPVIVSVMRDELQKEIPFWLEASGFSKTEETVSNQQSRYEVWQKAFPAGEVGLGINGFDKHRLVYFVGVKAQNEGDNLEINPVFPKVQPRGKLEVGAYTYKDWDQLVLTSVPQSMQGQVLLPTFRGRAREAHLIKAFRKTAFPSSSNPDQILLTWKDDPATSVVVQWRNAEEVKKSILTYWEAGSTDTLRQAAERSMLEDRLLSNDRKVNRFKVKLASLKPATRYHYYIESDQIKSSHSRFETAGKEDAFSFIWFGDTHNDEKWGKLLQKAHQKFPDVSFYSIAGDLVNTGLHRDDWDKFFAYSGDVFRSKPLLAVPGNHDSQDGLGASLFKELLTFPENGPKSVPPGFTYSLGYENALFLMIDGVSFSVQEQTLWIEEQLKNSDARWKFVTFHFSPYNSEESYPDIIEHWIPLFDKYKVDLVMSGHYHYYMRSFPLFNNQVVDHAADGTHYIMSIGAFNKQADELAEPYAAVKFAEGYLYQHVDIRGDTLSYQAIDSTGLVRDEFKVVKKE